MKTKRNLLLSLFLSQVLLHVEDPAAGGSAAPPPADTPPPVDPPPPAGGEQTPATPPPAEPGSVQDEIDKYNASIEDDEDDVDDSDAEGTEDEEGGAEDGSSRVDPATDGAATPDVKFEDTDDVATVLEKGKTLKEAYEIDPALNAYIEKLETQASTAVNPLGDIPASVDTVKKIATAFDRLYEPVDDGKGGVTVNTAPIVDLFRTEYTNEFPQITDALLATDSTKFPGQSVFEEKLIENFGAKKASDALAYLNADIPLPVIPAGATLPEGLAETVKEAYMQLPELKRFEIEGLMTDVKNLRERMADASDYARADLEKELSDKDAKLKIELKAVEDAQFRINDERQRQAREENQRVEAAKAFTNKVNTEYNAEIFGMADTFAKDLAPRLTFADAAAQMPLARDLQARVFNALAFSIDDVKGTYAPDSLADYYAGQLKEEGVKFDFQKGRELLMRHHFTTARLIRARETPGTSKQLIEKIEAEKRQIMAEIKTNQTDLLGQITSRYVKSTTAALNDKVAAQQKKKQAARPRISGNAAATGGQQKPTAQAIKDYNRRVDRALAEDPGTRLFRENAVPK